MRQAFHKPETSAGAYFQQRAGHWIRMAGTLAPLIIGELVHDNTAKWRYIRIASVLTAALTQWNWRDRVKRDEECERSR